MIARSALTGVRALVINTLSTSTRVLLTFININALPTKVQLESFVAFTPIAPRSWNAASILTEISKQLAVISDIDWQHPWWFPRRVWIFHWWSRDWNWRSRRKARRNRVNWRNGAKGWGRISWSLRNYQGDRAQLVEILCCSDGTHLRGNGDPWRPASANITAALHFCYGLGQLVRTAPICQSCVTVSGANIYASGTIGRGVKTRRTLAKVTADCVCTLAPITDSRNGTAFVNIFTFL